MTLITFRIGYSEPFIEQWKQNIVSAVVIALVTSTELL